MDFVSYQAVLLDLDGTIYHEEYPLPGAVELIRRLQDQKRKFACISNSTTSPLRLSERLGRMGVEVDSNHIYTAAAATADYVIEHFPINQSSDAVSEGDNKIPHRPLIFNLATEGIEEMLDGRVDWTGSADQPCDAVIIGAPTNVYATEDRQRIALQLLRKGAALVGIGADRVYPSPRGIEFGCGAFGWMFSYAANVKPIFCGKPDRIFFEELCRRLEVRTDGCILVGDNLESDIGGGKAVGMDTILTLTGITHRRDLASLPPERTPDWVVEDLRELL